MFESSYAFKLPMCRSIFVAKAVMIDASDWRAVANAYTVFVAFSDVNSPKHRYDALAKTVNNSATDPSGFADTHAISTSSCALKWPTCFSDSIDSNMNNNACDWPTVAKAQAVLAKSCTPSWPWSDSDYLANATDIGAANDSCTVANDHIVPASYCAVRSATRLSS